MSTMGGYHEYPGECSGHLGISRVQRGDIMINVGKVIGKNN